MKRVVVGLFLLGLALGPSSACGPSVDLAKDLEVTDVLTGYYDAGLKDGWNYLLPSISFRLHNKGAVKIGPVQVTAAFWKKGEDGDWQSVVLQGIHAGGLAPGASTESLTARSDVGYRIEGPRADLFTHSQFKDVTAKMFASQGGAIVALGNHDLEHTIIPHIGK